MSSERPGGRPERNPWNPGTRTPLENLEHKVSVAEKTITGERMFGDVALDDIKHILGELSDADAATPLVARAQELMRELPAAEVRNCIKRTEAFQQQGQHEAASEWRDMAIQRLATYKRAGDLDPATIEELRQQIEAIPYAP